MEVSRVGRRCLGQLPELHPIPGEAPPICVSEEELLPQASTEIHVRLFRPAERLKGSLWRVFTFAFLLYLCWFVLFLVISIHTFWFQMSIFKGLLFDDFPQEQLPQIKCRGSETAKSKCRYVQPRLLGLQSCPRELESPLLVLGLPCPKGAAGRSPPCASSRGSLG